MKSVICLTRAIRFSFLLALTQMCGGTARAVVTTFFGEDLNSTEAVRLAVHPNSDIARAQFLSRLVANVGTESFENFPDGTLVPFALTFPGSSGSITATLSGTGEVDVLGGTGTRLGRYPISGTHYLDSVNSSNTPDAFQIDFSSPIVGFGFYGTDFGDFNGQTQVELVGVGGSEILSIGNSVNVAGGSTLFFGLVNPDRPFSSVIFRNTNPIDEDFFGFDDVTVADAGQVIGAIPEPGTCCFGIALVCCALSARKRSRSV